MYHKEYGFYLFIEKILVKEEKDSEYVKALNSSKGKNGQRY